MINYVNFKFQNMRENEPSDGHNLERVRLNELVDSDCPNCGKSPVSNL